MTDMQYRSLEVRNIDLEGRTIELIVAPYGEPAVMGAGRSEQYAAGVFGELEGRTTPLKLETGPNHAGPVVGRSVSFDDTPGELRATFVVSETRDGDDALTLARDGALGASAGFLMLEAADLGDGLTEVRSGDLREVTLTGVPAHLGAGVVAVRSIDNMGENMTDQDVRTDAAADTDNDELESRVTDLVTRALDDYRAGVADTSAPAPNVTSTARGHDHRSIGELLGDVIAHGRNTDPGATERVTHLIERGALSADGRSLDLETRDGFPTPGTSAVDGIGVSPDSYIPDLLELLREGRPVANMFAGRSLPARGNNVSLPSVTQGGTVDYQATQGTQVSNQNVVTAPVEFPKSTLAGGQGVSIQAQEWSDPSYMTEVIRDHVAAYGEKLDLESIVGDGATPNATAYTGILAGAGDVPGGTTVATALAVIGKASAAVYAATKRPASAVICHSSVWGAWVDLADTDGRPIVTTDQPTNPAGNMDASSIVGTVRGLPVVVDDNVPVNLGVGTNETPIIVCNFRDALLFENQGAPAQIALTYPSVLVTDVTVYGFSALAIRRPLAFQAISGVLTPT